MTSALFGTICFADIGPALAKGNFCVGDPAHRRHRASVLRWRDRKIRANPLYVWLPDAMEGPTPVSALIHAATMVTAGVYMVTRTSAIYQLAPAAMAVVAMVGAITALFAASMALVQTDIKKVLAYSTVSQLGYMFLACGVGAFTAGIFHLMTHAFFKGLLFLAAGSVIHALSGEQDMRKMGALSKKIPITYWTMLIATLAIAGIFPFAGFLSKDLILGKAYEKDVLLWAIGYFTAGMTAFYMFRLIFMTFHGQSRVDHEVEHHIHESPPRCSFRSWFSLSFPSQAAGSRGRKSSAAVAPSFGSSSRWSRYRRIACRSRQRSQFARWGNLLMLLSEGLVVCGILAAWFLYIKRSELPQQIANRLGWFYRLVYNKYYVDQIYDSLIVNRAKDLGLALGAFDRTVVDGAGVNGAGWLTRFISKVSMWWDTWIVDGSVRFGARIVWLLSYPVRMVQDGLVQSYMLLIVIGLIGFLAYYFHIAHQAMR